MSPRTEAKNKEIRDESIQKIMDAAFNLFARKGYESTSMAEIAKSAGVSKGLLYNYFSSKEELLERLINSAMEASDAIIQQQLTDDAATTLKNLLRWFFAELRSRPDYWRLMTELTLQVDKFPFVHAIVTQKTKAYYAFLEDLLQQIGFSNPSGEAKLLSSVFDGIGIQFIVVREQYPLDELEKLLIEKYCKRKS